MRIAALTDVAATSGAAEHQLLNQTAERLATDGSSHSQVEKSHGSSSQPTVRSVTRRSVLSDPELLRTHVRLRAVAQPRILEYSFGHGPTWCGLPYLPVRVDARTDLYVDVRGDWHELARLFPMASLEVLVCDPPLITDARRGIVGSLLAVRARIDEGTNELADLVVSDEQLGLSSDERLRLKQLLVRLLSLPPIVLAWKAVNVLYEHERTYHTARTITELRPLYGESVSDPPSAAVIVHSLKLSYHASDGVTDDIFVGLDNGDVEDLIEVLQRTQEKTRTLKQMMTNSGVPVLDPLGDDS